MKELVNQLNEEILKQKLQGVIVKIQQTTELKTDSNNTTHRVPQLSIKLYKEI